MTVFRKLKNAGLSKVGKIFLNRLLRRKLKNFGQITTLKVDSAIKSVFISADLHGEEATLSIQIIYCLERCGKKTLMKPIQVSCNKEWIAILATRFFVGQSLEIPKGIAKLNLL